ncbi:Choline/ethanolamine kinase [Aspergillus sclerotialis]|uniref:Choline/ethanolamine kinase n=1 Tax=Aspergillus sclerotialis TaxID=2070753 RepID=A0A3A2ZNL4_9EURO|nr:Choline/ethanolamine kinase [Aspergillus sclerotialis]
MLEDLQKPARPLLSNSELRSRIYDRYIHCGGTRYENQLLDMLPQSERSVFTHGDIAPRNVMADEQNNVTGILDWELGGWYPEYWDMPRSCDRRFGATGRSGWTRRRHSVGI